MELLVAADSFFYKTPDGKYWSKTIYGYDFWLRYLDVFEKIVVVSRVASAEYGAVDGYLEVYGPNLKVIELPNMRGMKQYSLNYFKFNKAAKDAVKNSECALIRMPSVSASMVLKYFKKLNKPYSLEVVVDPYDAYSSNRFAQTFFTKQLKKEVLKANGVSYVTEYYLQEKYPCFAKLYGETEEHFESYFSTIKLPIDYFSTPKIYGNEKEQYTIIHTANNVNNNIKGHEVLINIVKVLRDKGYDLKVVFIGDGDKRNYFEKIAMDLDLSDYVSFTGLLSTSQKVREVLLSGDLFVFPTKAEGLPRAIIEAMAVGLPCLSTPVNGIPELLNEEYLFEPMNVNGFANKIEELINSPKELEKMSKENIEKAKEYSDHILSERRQEFYMKLKNLVGNSSTND